MREIFTLEIVNHEDGQVIESTEGTPYSLSMLLQDILENLPHGHGVIINAVDDD